MRLIDQSQTMLFEESTSILPRYLLVSPYWTDMTRNLAHTLPHRARYDILQLDVPGTAYINPRMLPSHQAWTVSTLGDTDQAYRGNLGIHTQLNRSFVSD